MIGSEVIRSLRLPQNGILVWTEILLMTIWRKYHVTVSFYKQWKFIGDRSHNHWSRRWKQSSLEKHEWGLGGLSRTPLSKKDCFPSHFYFQPQMKWAPKYKSTYDVQLYELPSKYSGVATGDFYEQWVLDVYFHITKYTSVKEQQTNALTKRANQEVRQQ